MLFSYRAIILSALLCLAAARTSAGHCDGHDLFPTLKSQAPAAYAAIEAAASEMPFHRGKLFRLSRTGTEPSYVFGTLHASDPRITSFSSNLRAAIMGSKLVVLESVETGDVLRRMIAKNPAAWRRATRASEDRRPDRLLSKADFAQLKALVARKGLSASVAREFKPAALALLLDEPDCDRHASGAKPYVDKLVANVARENNVETIGLESMIEQIEVLNGLPPDIERDLLVAALRQADHGEDVAETAVARYVEATPAVCSLGCGRLSQFPASPKRRFRKSFSTG